MIPPIEMILDRLAQLERMVGNFIRVGKVEEVDYETATARVRLETELLSDWLPWVTRRAGGDVDWWAPEIGEQVTVFSPGGEPRNAFIGPSLYQDTVPAPANLETVHHKQYADGTVITYDREAKKLTATLASGGTAEITADGGITVTGDVAITGNVAIDGTIDSTGNITSEADVSDGTGALSRLRGNFNSHKHIGNMGSPTSPTDTPDA